MKTLRQTLMIFAFLGLFTSFSKNSFVLANDTDKPLIVGTLVTPPFAFKKPTGEWTGISIELWDRIAKDMGLKYEFKQFKTTTETLKSVENKEIDLAIAAITINEEREKRLDFGHPYIITGMGIALNKETQNSTFLTTIKALFNYESLRLLSYLILLLLSCGLIIWIVERKSNPEQFDKSAKRGIFDGFWWSAVTLTTVGYGDKAPKTVLGKIFGIIWMFIAIIVLSFFTAAITSVLTVSSLETKVKNLRDLRAKNYLVGAPLGSCENFLKEESIKTKQFKNSHNGLKALAKQEVDAYFCDKPLLQYIIAQKHAKKLFMLDKVFAEQGYGIAFPTGSNLRGKSNEVLLKFIEDESYWKPLLKKYLGKK